MVNKTQYSREIQKVQNTNGYVCHTRFRNKPKTRKGHTLNEWAIIPGGFRECWEKAISGGTVIGSEIDLQKLTEYRLSAGPKDSITEELFTETKTFIIDVDHVPSGEINKDFWKYSSGAHASASSVLTENGHTSYHVFFQLPTAITRNLFNKFIRNFYRYFGIAEKADSCSRNISQIYYGCDRSDGVIKPWEDTVIPEKIVLEIFNLMAGEITEVSPRVTTEQKLNRVRKADSVISKLDQHFLSHKKLPEIIDVVCPGWDYIEERSNNTFEQYVGVRPLNDGATSKKGFSIFQSSLDDCGIYCCHKAGNITLSLYELGYRLEKKAELGLESADPQDLPTPEFTGELFKSYVNSLCAKLGIPEFFGSKVPLSDFLRIRRGKVEKSGYDYWCFRENVWKFTMDGHTVAAECVHPWMKMSGKDKEQDKKTGEWEEIGSSALGQKALKLLKYISPDPEFSGMEPVIQDENLIGFQNGIFSISDQSLGEFSHTNKVLYLLPFEYEKIAKDDPQVAAHLDFLRKLLKGDETQFQILIDWYAATFCGLGNQWGNALALYGLSGSGKSALIKALGYIYDEMLLECKTDNIAQNKYPFSEFDPGKTKCILLDDVTNVNADNTSGDLYPLFTENSRLRVDQKYLPCVTYRRTFTTAITSESLPIGDGSKAGMFRRITGIPLRWGEKSLKSTECVEGQSMLQGIQKYLCNAENMRRFYLWVLQHVSPGDVIERYGCIKRGDSSDELKEEFSRETTESAFVEEFLEFGDEDDYVITGDLARAVVQFARESNDTRLSNTPFSRVPYWMKKVVLSNHKDAENFNLIQAEKGTKARRKVNGETKAVIYGLRWSEKGKAMLGQIGQAF